MAALTHLADGPPAEADRAAANVADTEELAALYRLVAELFVYPEQRDAEEIETGLAALRSAPAELRRPIETFLASPRARDCDEYLAVMELSPPCPPYLGTYLYAEPKSCLGAGVSGRNGYLIELAGAYRHFGFAIAGELADFLPAMAEFLAISLERPERDGIGLRRRFLEVYFEPGLKPMREALEQYQSPYSLLVEALQAAMQQEAIRNVGEALWLPPARDGRPAVGPVITHHGRRLPAEAIGG